VLAWGMPDFMPFVIIALALVAAVSIGYIAWELSDDEFHRSFEQEKRHDADPEDSGER
jgi:hypothetical protein